MYVPGPSGVGTSIVSAGPKIEPYKAAQMRLKRLAAQKDVSSVDSEFDETEGRRGSNVEFKIKPSDLTTIDEQDNTACSVFISDLEKHYEAKILQCQAYKYEFVLGHKQLIAYDFVVTIPIETAEERAYPTNLVDSAELMIEKKQQYVKIKGIRFAKTRKKPELVLILSIEEVQ